MKRWSRQLIIGVSVALSLAGVAASDSSDPPMVSQGAANGGNPLYSITESEVGGVGDYGSISAGLINGTPQYQFGVGTDDGGSTLGDNFAGNSSSNGALGGYNLGAGFNTTNSPALTFSVGTSSVDLGVLSSSVASTTTATFNVKNYTSYGYVITLIGAPPSNSGHQLTAMGTQSANNVGCSPACASAAGTEQFGVNLRANTSPVTVGADAVQNPAGFGFGTAGDGITGTYGTDRPYTVPGRYRFFSGDTIASAPKSSGETDYTMTFLANITPTTPGGKYTGALTLVATGTY